MIKTEELMNAQPQMQQQTTELLCLDKDNLPAVVADNQNYKLRLRAMPEVEALTNEIIINDANSILQFGQKPSEGISRMSDELLSQMKSIKTNEISQMLTNLTKLMDKFDIKEIENPKKQGLLKKIFSDIKAELEKMFEKYDYMGREVDNIYMLLKQYEMEIRRTNDNLVRQYEENVNFFEQLERYIVAGEMGMEQIEAFKNQLMVNNAGDPDLQMKVQQLDMAKDMLSQRIYDLQIAENVAMQTCPMIQTMQMSNFNLLRKINSSFIITLPIFKQCLVQAIQLKRQEIQARAIKELDDKTNELLIRNAQNTAQQSVKIAQMTGGSSIQLETLQQTYETIKRGIAETRQITNDLAEKRQKDSLALEDIKSKIKKENLI